MWGTIIGGSLLGAASLGSGLIGGLMNQTQADSNNQFAMDMFERNLAWQQQQWKEQVELANTAHQREVKDLRAAGLNPILSATGGSGLNTPTGHAGVGIPNLQQADWSSALQGAMQSAINGIGAMTEFQRAQSQIALNDAQIAKHLQDISASKELTPFQRNLLEDQARFAAAQANNFELRNSYYRDELDHRFKMWDAQSNYLQHRIFNDYGRTASALLGNLADFLPMGRVSRMTRTLDRVFRRDKIQQGSQSIKPVRSMRRSQYGYEPEDFPFESPWNF